jgi:hypothetical protein
MKIYRGGQEITKGVYMSLSKWEMVQQYGEKPVLAGTSEERYFKVPAPLAMIAGPFAGLAFILFLPFIGIVGIVSFLAYKLGRGALTLGRKGLQPVMVSWMPGRAYLTRKGGVPVGKTPDNELNARLPHMSISEIEEEITKRRDRGEK